MPPSPNPSSHQDAGPMQTSQHWGCPKKTYSREEFTAKKENGESEPSILTKFTQIGHFASVGTE